MTADLFQETAQYSVEILGSHEQWLSSRGKGIGGSDAAALCDQSRFKTLQDLWFEKIQGLKKPVCGPNVEYGKTAEPALRILYQAKHLDQDVQYMEDTVLISKNCSWRRYSPDGLIWEPETGRRGILEIKTSQVNNGHKAQEWAEGVPIEYRLQVLHGLLVTGFDFVTVTAELRFWDGRVNIIERSYTRDEVRSDLEALDRRERENWEKYFAAEVIPPLALTLQKGQEMELELIPRMENGELQTNAAELVEAIKQELAKYNYIVDETNYQQAKADRSFLNKAVTQISNSRKLLEDKVFGTWKADKEKIMAVERELKASAEALGNGIRVIDDEEKAEKAKNLEACWNAAGGNKYRFDGILAEHKSWLNKTAKRDVIAIEMQKELHDLGLQEKQIEKETADLEEAQQVYLMEAWYKSRDYQQTLQAAQNIRTANEKIAAMAKVEEEQKQSPVTRTEPHSEPKAFEQSETQPEKIYRRAFIVEGNESQLRALIGCMQQTGLRILSIAKKDIPDTLPFGQ